MRDDERTPMTKPDLQPCTDPACGVHGHGADPDARTVTCVRQILRAYDRPGAIALLDQQPIESFELGEERSVIPLSSPPGKLVGTKGQPGLIQPGQSFTILVTANQAVSDFAKLRGVRARHVRSFRPAHLSISSAGTEGGAADWIVNDVVLDGRSQFAPHRNLPGAIFGSQTSGTLHAFDRISGEAPIEVTVTYVGARPTPFFGTLVGSFTYDRRSIQLGGGRFAPDDVRELTVKAVCALDVLKVLVQGPAQDFIVGDIKINDVSQFVQEGDIPGDMFGCRAIDSFVAFRPIKVGDEVTIILKYVGIEEASLECSILGQESACE
jgi:hypothetical protein